MQTEIRKFGIERCVELLKLCESPDKKLKIVHIAGTNGKGSTAAYISSVLKCAGKKVGTFSSPQVFCYEEQFLINQTPIPTQLFAEYYERVKALSSVMDDKPSPFELETATALYAFYKEGCEYAVIECGLGGRDDATNAISQKSVAVFTSISKEHTAELGPTVLDICRAKSGIIKNCPVVISNYQSEEVKNFFSQFNPVFAGIGLEEEEANGCNQAFKYGGKHYQINMLGMAQLYNAATAIEACKQLFIEDKFISQGLKVAVLGGRLQIEKKRGVTYILDGAHNPGALKELSAVLKNMQGEKELVFGCLSDKDVEEAAKILCPHFKKAYLFSPASVRAMPLEKIEQAFLGKVDYLAAKSVTCALEKTKCKVVVICGSFTIIKEAAEWINKQQ